MDGWKRRIVAWGNSMAIRLPSQLFRKTNFKEGDTLEFQVEDEHTLKLVRVDEAEEQAVTETRTPTQD